MPISYNRLLEIFKKKGVTSYTVTKKNKIIGQATWKKIHENGHIDTRTIEALCKYLDCQPGDIMEYIPDGENQCQNTDDTTFQPEISNKARLIVSNTSDATSNQNDELPDELKELFENQESHQSISDMLNDATTAIDGVSQLGNIALPDKKKKAVNKHLPYENEF